LRALFLPETLKRRNIDTIWDDRAWHAPSAVFDGVPQVEMVAPDASVPPPVIVRGRQPYKLPA